MTAPHVPCCIPLLLTTYYLILTPSLLTTYSLLLLSLLLTPSPKNYILNFRHSLMRCIVVRGLNILTYPNLSVQVLSGSWSL